MANVNPHDTGNTMSITLKQDGQNGMWTVFHGSPAGIRENLIEAFNMADTDDLTLHEVSLEAQRIYKGAGNASTILGARPVGGAGKSSEAWKKAQATESAPAEPAEPERNPLLDKIAAAASVDVLRHLWAENRPAFDENPDLLSQWKLQGKALAEAAAKAEAEK